MNKIYELTGYHPDVQRLIFEGRVLMRGNTL
jgi:hypothetical protein